ncbi:hydrogenase small subunit [Sedimenticola hydrogenitrophicus]|uniref:hydrogenase small subunit n=1 Tax=Sedimenticola hydrogenitrophicus TaxID=2967975 RepID=UPI0021A47180|nr:hydrogenase small subunit [Sedimenticola hydrogenitrophicus]
MNDERNFEQLEKRLGVSRRDFMKFCTGVAATMGLTTSEAMAMANAVASPKARPPVIWLHGQECTGCTESLLRSEHPTIETLILDLISLDYHETLAAAAGHQVEAAKQASMKANKGKYLLVIEGATPVKDGGIYCKIGGKTMLDHVKEAAEGAAAIVAIGSCASWGGIPSSGINPTEAKGAPAILTDKTVVTIPGCPPNPYNFLSTVLHFVTFGKLPALDHLNRPKFAYGRLIHENCERRPHFDAGRFALEFGDEGHQLGYCLYKLGCKGPETYANCPAIEFGDVGGGAWPVGVGHPCFGCTEQGIGFTKAIHELADVKTHAPPNAFPYVDDRQGTSNSTPGAAALVGGVIGAAVGATAMAARKLGKSEEAGDGDNRG